MIAVKTIRSLTSKAACREHVQLHFGGDQDSFVRELNQTLNRLINTDLHAAERLLVELKRVFTYLEPEQSSRLLAMEARLAHRTGASHQAVKKYEQARASCRRRGDHNQAALIAQGLIEAYMYAGQPNKALALGRRTIKYFEQRGNTDKAAKVMTNVGNVYHRQDRNKLALRYYDRARKLFERERGIPLATIDFNRANIYANMNQLTKATRLYQQAIRGYRGAGADLACVKIEYSLAYLDFLKDDYARAMAQFETVQDELKRLGDPKTAAVAGLDLMEIYLYLNQPGSVITRGADVISALKALRLDYEVGKAMYFVGLAHLRLEDLSDAAAWLRKARRRFSATNNQLWQGLTMLAQGQVAQGQRRFATAIARMREAHRYFRNSQDRRRQVDVDVALVKAELSSGRRKSGLARAGRLKRRKLLHYQRFQLYDTLSAHYRDEGDVRAALECSRRAIRTVEGMLNGLYPDEIRFFFLLDKFPTYLRTVSCLLQLDRTDDAFLSMARALQVVNHPVERRGRKTTSVAPALIAAREQLRAQLKRMYTQPMQRTRHLGAGTTAALEHRLLRYTKQIGSGDFKTLASVADEYVERLRPIPGTSIVTFVLLDGQAGTFVQDDNRVNYVKLAVSGETLQGLLHELQFLMEQTALPMYSPTRHRAALTHYLEHLYQAVIAPLENRLGDREVIIIADGLFGQIPWPALRRPDGKFFKDVVNFSLVTRPATATARPKTRLNFSRKRNAVLAVPSEALPGIKAETAAIAGVYPGLSSYVGDSATADALFKELHRSNGFVHIATHAARSSENPLFSRLLMADGPVFPFDLFADGIRSTLVTLSGCQTAAPGVYQGNSFSLAKAFHQAGARFVLASLWNAPDTNTMEFMKRFYHALGKLHSPVAAYRSALHDHDANSAGADAWAGFVLIGR